MRTSPPHIFAKLDGSNLFFTIVPVSLMLKSVAVIISEFEHQTLFNYPFILVSYELNVLICRSSLNVLDSHLFLLYIVM